MGSTTVSSNTVSATPARPNELLAKFEEMWEPLGGGFDGDGAEDLLVREIRDGLRALDEARHEVVGGRESRVSRDLLSAMVRLQAASAHVVAMVLGHWFGERAVKG